VDYNNMLKRVRRNLHEGKSVFAKTFFWSREDRLKINVKMSLKMKNVKAGGIGKYSALIFIVYNYVLYYASLI